MIVKNNSKSVIVLKAAGLPALRLFPGYNTVKENEIGQYFEGNPAAQGQKKMYLSVVEGDEMTATDKAKADKAKEKNELLNKAQRIIQKNKKEMSKNSKTIADQGKVIEELQTKMKELEDKMKEDPKEKSEKPADKGKDKDKK